MSDQQLANTTLVAKTDLNTIPTRQSHLPFLPGIDGLRAIAVSAVLLYHAGLNWMPGGFLGVEVFFVISGYLITSLLLAERKNTGQTKLKVFWWHRARRLLPALFLLLLSTLVFSVIFLPDEVIGLRGDVAAALGYVTNWQLIFNQRSYFESAGRPPLLQHLWSLAVEEQFYIVWPLLFTLVMSRPWRRWLPWMVGVAALLSSLWMALLYQPDVDPSRIYYGTDTRAAGLLVGVGLALVWSIPQQISWQGRRTQLTALFLNLAGGAALLTLLVFFITINEFQAFLYQGGFTLLALATAVLILATVHPLSHLGVWLNWLPLRWIGLRSYSIYLWHWPVFNLTRPQLDIALDGLPLLALRLALTLLLAELSYRFIETPFRRGALEKWWREWRQAEGQRRRGFQVRLVAGSSLAGVLLVTLIYALATARSPQAPDYIAHAATSSTPVIFEDTPSAQPDVPATSQPAPATVTAVASPFPEAPVALPELATATPAPTATPLPTPTPRPVPPITAVGDSVLLGAGNELHKVLGPMIYEADVGLQAKGGVDMLRSFRDQGLLGPTVIIHLGTNGYFSAKSFDDMMSIAGSSRRVFFLNVRVPREWQNPNNQVIREGVKRYPNAYLIDWYSRSAGHPEYFVKDGFHLSPDGVRAYNSLIKDSIGK